MCDATLKSDIDGHVETWWFALTSESFSTPKRDGCIQSPESNTVVQILKKDKICFRYAKCQSLYITINQRANKIKYTHK